MPYNLYCTKTQLGVEGFDITIADPYWPNRIQMASEYIEQVTARWFGAIERGNLSVNDPIRIDGTQARIIEVPIPIVQIDDIKIVHESIVDANPTTTLSVDSVRVYNRHLTQGLIEPDDREAPRLEIESFTGGPGAYLHYFPDGSQNIELHGWFGYTELAIGDAAAQDPADSQVPLNQGEIPLEINRLAMLLCGFLQGNIADKFGAGAMNPAVIAQQWPVTEMKTRDQSIKFGVGGTGSGGGGARFSSLTGNPEIDGLLAKYRRAARIGMLGDHTAKASRAWWV